MEHSQVEEQGLVALYRRGGLDAETEQRFEEHFFSCSACQEELDHQRRFELGLRAMRAEPAAEPAAEPGRLLRFPARPAVRLALAASLLLAIALPFAGLWRSRGSLEREAAAWRERARAGESERTRLAARLAGSERARRESEEARQRLERRLAESPPQQIAANTSAEGFDRPLAAAPLLLLARLRGTGANDPPPDRLDLGNAPGVVQLAVDPGTGGFASYRVTLRDAAGRERFAAGDLHPNALEVILLTFPRGFFAAGEYRLRLDGRRADGGFEEVETYRFLAVQ